MPVGQVPGDADDHYAQVEELIAKGRTEKFNSVINSGDNAPGAVDYDVRQFTVQRRRDCHRFVGILANESPIFHASENHGQPRPGWSLDLNFKHVASAGIRPCSAANFGDTCLVMFDLWMRGDRMDAWTQKLCGSTN